MQYFACHYLRSFLVTGHFPGTNQKVTPYWGVNMVNFDSPRYFQAFCDEKNRKFGVLFNAFDENGKVYSPVILMNIERPAAKVNNLFCRRRPNYVW